MAWGRAVVCVVRRRAVRAEVRRAVNCILVGGLVGGWLFFGRIKILLLVGRD